MNYEGYLTYKVTDAVTQQPLGAGHATIPHIKPMDVPFHMIYGSLMCAKRLQSDRQNKRGLFADPSWTPKYDHKIPISWTMVLIFVSAGSPECPLS